MWFKNLKIFRLSPEFNFTAADLETKLERQLFQPGNRSDMQNMGWVSPCNNGALVHAINGQYLLALRVEKKLLPASVINQTTKEKCLEIEEQQGYRPGRKQLKEIKEQVTEELLPKAFAVQKDTRVWLDTKNHWLIIDAASSAKSDEVIGMLAKVLDPLPVQSLFTELSPSAAMTEWLLQDEAPANFSIDQDTDLVSKAESSATVRYIRQTPESGDVAKHIQNGKVCTKLAMTWADRISFVLNDSLDIKRIKPLDILKEGGDFSSMDEAERFDADMTLMCAELAKMLDDLVLVLGGEKLRQGNEQKAT
ncbi:recombination-associated protein RdgC [Advenella sp. WQ 585]|uniref:Recombination-associated protein RdgC n=1 Tax=Advenella mandrilli TaxID=2800330 RepID=A0ABS1EE23_9BURK|nr:recombination-associated protein RdgC [Advenella mandrilli]MBK1780600.1 recombination-associated protein RdgC [Advenella mandrilli]